MKTITISDDVYEKLKRLKGKNSFSALIAELMKNNKINTTSDDVYGMSKWLNSNEIKRLKGKKSFSALIAELMRKNVEKRIEMLIRMAEETGYEDELERVSREIRRGFRVRG